MLDFSMGEIGIIAAVALVVLGPDKLPQVAKTAGTLMGKAQRFVSQVKNDIDKEVELSELKKIQEDAKKMASDLEADLRSTQNQFEKEVSEVNSAVNSMGKEIQTQIDEVSKEAEKQTDAVKQQWLADASPKPVEAQEASIENMVDDGKPAVDVSEWDLSQEEVDTSDLESAFDWPQYGTVTTPAVETSLVSVAEPVVPVAVEPVSSRTTTVTLEDLAKEIDKLKAQLGQKRPSARYARTLRRNRINKSSYIMRAHERKGSRNYRA